MILGYPNEASIQQLCTSLKMPDALRNVLTVDALNQYVTKRVGALNNPLAGFNIHRWQGRHMNHPDTLNLHQTRVSIFAKELGRFLGVSRFSTDRVQKIGLYHDSPEIVSPFGDVITPVKYGLTAADYRVLVSIETIVEMRVEKALDLGQGFYAGYRNMSETEHHLVKLADILDAFFVAAMEVRSGNTDFEAEIRGISRERFYQLANNGILERINFTEHAKELMRFIENIQTTSPPELWNLWKDIFDKVKNTSTT